MYRRPTGQMFIEDFALPFEGKIDASNRWVKLANQDKGPDTPTGGSGQPEENKGEPLPDATCAPADIKYPTDLSLLNEAREKTEKTIDALYNQNLGLAKKPRTYRKLARRGYLKIAKQRKPHGNAIRKAIGKQLGYLHRNLDARHQYRSPPCRAGDHQSLPHAKIS